MRTKEPTIRQLRDLVEGFSRQNPHLTTRLEKAAFLVLLRRVEPLGKARYRVGSEDGLRDYQVLNGHCECTDYLRHGAGHPCKHRLAVAFQMRLEGSSGSAPECPSRVGIDVSRAVGEPLEGQWPD